MIGKSENLQRDLLTDFLDEDQSKTHSKYFQFELWKDYLSKMKFEELYAEQGDVIIHRAVPEQIVKDKGWMEFARTYNIYLEKKGNPYVFSPYLSNILYNTSVTDLDYSDFPEEFYGYIELPGLKDEYEKEILGVFVTVFKDTMIKERKSTNEKLIKMVAITSEGPIPEDFKEKHVISFPKGFSPHKAKLIAINWLFIGLKEGQTFQDGITNVVTTNNFNYLEEQPVPTGTTLWKHTVLNALIFIRYSTTETIAMYNEFATKKSKADAQKRLYTEKEFYYCDLEKKIEYKVDSTFVIGHFRWQPYGRQRSLKKLIYIAPNKRTYKKKIEQQVNEVPDVGEENVTTNLSI